MYIDALNDHYINGNYYELIDSTKAEKIWNIMGWDY